MSSKQEIKELLNNQEYQVVLKIKEKILNEIATPNYNKV